MAMKNYAEGKGMVIGGNFVREGEAHWYAWGGRR